MNLNEIKDYCYSCTKCAIGKEKVLLKEQNGRSNVFDPHVFSRGNPQAKLFLVGQNPGKNEVIERTPFIGDSGKELKEIMKEVGLDEESVYITNGVKCFTAGNSLPANYSVMMCKDILEKELELVSPKVVLVMGASAFRSFGFPVEYSVELCRKNEVYETDLHPFVMVTIHPAYIFRNREAREVLSSGLLQAKLYAYGGNNG